MKLRCKTILVSYDGQRLYCERKAGHKGAHRLSREDEQESSRMMMRFMRKALSK